MIRYLLHICLLFVTLSNVAQQSTSSIFRDVQKNVYNPSISALKSEWSAIASHRLLMSNMQGSPMSNMFAFNTNVKKKHGFGIVVSQSKRSVFQEFEGYLNYGYGVRLGGAWKLGMGLGAGVKSQSINLSNQIYFNNDDPYLTSQAYNATTYDARFGLTLTSSRFFLGVSALQLIGQRFNNNLSNLQQNILVNADYRIDLVKNLVLRPQISSNLYLGGPLQYNAGAELMIKNFIGIGAIYRSDYAITGTLQLKFKGISVGYGFDLVQTSETNLGLGHEIYLKFSKLKFDSKTNMMTKEQASDEVYALIDTYFDVQTSDLNPVEKSKLMNHIRNEIYELLPYLDDESRKAIEKNLKKKKKKGGD